jgi:hypothetical protein
MERLVEADVCKCKDKGWRRTIIKISIKILVSGIIKALITHIVLSHMKK